MLKAKALEAKLLEKIAAALPADIPPYVLAGFWQPSAPGIVKDVETIGSSSGLIEVATSLGRRQTASVSAVTFTVTVNLVVRLELDSQGEKLLDFTEPLQALFDGWMGANYQQPLTALDVPGLSIDGVGVDGGAPRLDIPAKVARVAWTLDLSGTYEPETTNT